MGDQSFIGQIGEVLLGDGRADPVSLNPALRQLGPRRGSAPTGRSPLGLRRRLLHPFQGCGLLLHHGCRQSKCRAAALDRRRAQREGLEAEGGEDWGRTVQNALSNALYGAASEWLTGRPRQSRHHPATGARTIRGEKGGVKIEASSSYPIRVPRFSPLRTLPKIRIPRNPLTAEQLIR